MKKQQMTLKSSIGKYTLPNGKERKTQTLSRVKCYEEETHNEETKEYWRHILLEMEMVMGWVKDEEFLAIKEVLNEAIGLEELGRGLHK